jgi:hypothetical protein
LPEAVIEDTVPGSARTEGYQLTIGPAESEIVKPDGGTSLSDMILS